MAYDTKVRLMQAGSSGSMQLRNTADHGNDNGEPFPSTSAARHSSSATHSPLWLRKKPFWQTHVLSSEATSDWTGLSTPWTGPSSPWTGPSSPCTGASSPCTGASSPWTGPRSASTWLRRSVQTLTQRRVLLHGNSQCRLAATRPQLTAVSFAGQPTAGKPVIFMMKPRISLIFLWCPETNLVIASEHQRRRQQQGGWWLGWPWWFFSVNRWNVFDSTVDEPWALRRQSSRRRSEQWGWHWVALYRFYTKIFHRDHQSRACWFGSVNRYY